jgi:23S rRNA (pseudouridine1915-N3)-methyltransferase
MNHETCRFIIGGADGLCTHLQKQVTKKISFGSMTWPHMFVRAMITEQIYRTITILNNHPYHRE